MQVLIVTPSRPVVATLARAVTQTQKVESFVLENPRSAARLEHPLQALEDLRGLVVIEEIQRRPDLFPVLRVLADLDQVLSTKSLARRKR